MAPPKRERYSVMSLIVLLGGAAEAEAGGERFSVPDIAMYTMVCPRSTPAGRVFTVVCVSSG